MSKNSMLSLYLNKIEFSYTKSVIILKSFSYLIVRVFASELVFPKFLCGHLNLNVLFSTFEFGQETYRLDMREMVLKFA